MILSDLAIQDAIKRGDLIIDPEPALEQYATTAVDLRLGEQIKVWDDRLFQPGVEVRLSLDDIDVRRLAQFAHDARLEADGSFVLQPRQFIVAQTFERIGFPINSKLAGRVEGRSSLARLGMVVHLTAPTIHADFGGKSGAVIALEIINWGPFHLAMRPGRTRICQLMVERVEGEFGRGLQSGFREQQTPLGG